MKGPKSRNRMVTIALAGVVFRETALVRGQARLSTFATRANLRFHTFHSAAQIGSRNSRREIAFFLQLSKSCVGISVADFNVSAPGRARIRFGTEAASNKKPGVERRVSPSTLRVMPSEGRVRAKLDYFYPEFVINLTSD